jgi:hypothetical protein
MPDPTIYVVCEGPTDKRVLEHLLNLKLGLFVQVKVAGGEDIPGRSGRPRVGSVRAYLEREAPGVIALAIQDRNFISLQQVDEGWQHEKGKTLVWHRHEIENYLLEPKVVARAFTRLRDADDEIVARRYRRLPTDEGAIAELLRDAARKLFEDHAAQLVAWELYTSADRGNPSMFRPRSPRPTPPARVPGRAEWLRALQEEAERVRGASLQVANLQAMLPRQIEERYDAELSRLLEPDFLELSVHLSEMGGHELMSAVCVELTSFGATFSRQDLTDVLTEALNDIYEPDRVFAADDFARLADRLRQLARPT